MRDLVRCLVTMLFTSRAKLAAENLALRHQLGVLGRSVKRPRLRKRDRIFWVWLSKLWPDWRAALVVVKPATVVAWHRKGFRLYWTWRRRRKGHGRPAVPSEVRQLIRNENHLRRILRDYLAYYHGCRTHLSLEKDSPEPRKVESPDQGNIVEIPMVGGLHHRYARLAA